MRFDRTYPRQRISRQLLKVAAVAIVAAGGLGTTMTASAATGTPTPTSTVTEPPIATPTDTPTDTPTPTPTVTGTVTPAPSPTATEVPSVNPWSFVGAMHGEFAVATKDGCGTITVLAQTGQVSAIAADSITVRSQDGYEQTYTIDENTRRPIIFRDRDKQTRQRGQTQQAQEIQQDAWVSVTATSDGTTATALNILDLSQPVRLHLQSNQDLRRAKQWWRMVMPAWQPPAPCPTPTETLTPIPSDTVTPPPTEIPTEIPTETPTETPTEPPAVPPTETPTETPTEPPAATPTETPTETPPTS